MFDLPYIVGNFPRHDTLKDRVLEMIEKQKGSSIKSYGEKITNTDWDFPVEDKEYAIPIYPIAIQTVTKFFHSMNYTDCRTGRIWFQQYKTSDYHSWHRHAGSDWNFVYYVELAEDAPPTEFRNPLNQEHTFLPTVKEGQFIIFPSLLEHRSNVNLSSKRKTIVAMNFNTI